MLYFLSSQVRRRWIPTRERQCCSFNPSSLLLLFVENKRIENEIDPSPVLVFRWRHDDAILSDTGTRWKRISTMERCHIRGYTNAWWSAWFDSTESKTFATGFSITQRLSSFSCGSLSPAITFERFISIGTRLADSPSTTVPIPMTISWVFRLSK